MLELILAIILFYQVGYLGVDVFFVITGYLITSILYKNLNSNLHHFLVDFYIRRIRRIFPALLFLLFSVTIISVFIFHDFFLETYSKSAISTLFFVSNIYFWSTGEEYAAFSSLYHPLLHTWSLAVEEQFYLIFPFILFFGNKFFKKKYQEFDFIIINCFINWQSIVWKDLCVF